MARVRCWQCAEPRPACPLKANSLLKRMMWTRSSSCDRCHVSGIGVLVHGVVAASQGQLLQLNEAHKVIFYTGTASWVLIERCEALIDSSAPFAHPPGCQGLAYHPS